MLLLLALKVETLLILSHMNEILATDSRYPWSHRLTSWLLASGRFYSISSIYLIAKPYWNSLYSVYSTTSQIALGLID